MRGLELGHNGVGLSIVAAGVLRSRSGRLEATMRTWSGTKFGSGTVRMSEEVAASMKMQWEPVKVPAPDRGCLSLDAGGGKPLAPVAEPVVQRHVHQK